MASFRGVCIFFVAGAFTPTALVAQVLQGRFEPNHVQGLEIFLFQARGGAFKLLDSTSVAADGSFLFSTRYGGTGFYQLAINDSDRVDLLLDGREPEVFLHFSALPLATHLSIERSNENLQLQKLVQIRAETNAIREAVQRSKEDLAPGDTLALHALDQVWARAESAQEQFLAGLDADTASSFLARTVVVDRALDAVQRKSPMAVPKVFNFSDASLLRSSLFDKAVMVFLQNINAVSEDQFLLASDTLMSLAGRGPDCRGYMLEHLIDLFATYGPERAVQHLLDRYVVIAQDSLQVSPELRTVVEKMMLVSVGRTAPGVDLNDHGAVQPLAALVASRRYTALFFYSSTCEHCHAQMPELKNAYETFRAKGFDVLGVALDVDSAEFLAGIKDNAIPWRCYSEFNGWGSTAARAFQVKGTPMIFLLDQRMRIVAKPATAKELGGVLRQLLP